MAKRKKAKGTAASGGEKVAFQVRCERETFERVKKLAEEGGVSLNQLVHGLLRWAAANGHAGEPKLRDDGKFAEVEPQEGVVYFGTPWSWVDEYASKEEFDSGDPSGRRLEGGKYYFKLDYTARHVVRED